jgi:hypothetical protein
MLYLSKQKGEVALIHVMKVYRSRSIAPLVPNLGTGWRWVDQFYKMHQKYWCAY